MSHARKYTVYDIVTNEALVTGTAMHCAETLGVNDRTIRAIERGEYRSRKYRVTANRPSENEQKLAKVAYSELGAAAKKWDEFVIPIRERYGIPVRHLG